ncbi:MAG: Kelch repeat-containing protein [Candidatus Limnocylindria bacterium]
MRNSLSVLVLALIVVACADPAASLTPDVATPSIAPTMAESAPPSAARATSTPTPEPTPSATPEPIAWQALEVTGPGAREDHTWTADPSTGVAYLFGGRDGTTVFGDLWAYDLEADAWTELAQTAPPEPRFGHEAVWVDGIGLVIFSGQSGPNFFNDLWAFDPEAETWVELQATGDVPVARYGSCASIGSDGRLWISHGFTSDGTRFNDTLAYDFDSGAWADETPDGDLPVNRCLHGCWWTDDGTLALFGGQTTGVTALDDRWSLADGEWTRVEGTAPPDRNLYARARVGGATLIFGGQALDSSFLNDAWLLSDGEADAVPIEIKGAMPPGRAGAEIVADAARNRVVLFGGRDADGGLADTWALTGVTFGGE